MKAVRERVLNCLGKLSDEIQGTKSYLQIYQDDQKLWEAAEDLYVGILVGVESMTLWLDEKAYSRLFINRDSHIDHA